MTKDSSKFMLDVVSTAAIATTTTTTSFYRELESHFIFKSCRHLVRLILVDLNILAKRVPFLFSLKALAKKSLIGSTTRMKRNLY